MRPLNPEEAPKADRDGYARFVNAASDGSLLLSDVDEAVRHAHACDESSLCALYVQYAMIIESHDDVAPSRAW